MGGGVCECGCGYMGAVKPMYLCAHFDHNTQTANAQIDKMTQGGMRNGRVNSVTYRMNVLILCSRLLQITIGRLVCGQAA